MERTPFLGIVDGLSPQILDPSVLPLTAERDFAPILAHDGETLGGDAVLGQITLNFAMH